MKELRQLFRYVVPYWKQMAAASISLFFWSLIGLALPYAVRFLVDSVFISHSMAQLNTITGVLLCLFVLQAVIGFGQNYLLIFVGQRVIADLRLAIQKHLVGLPLRFFSESRVGEIVSRVTNDVTIIQAALTDAPVALLRQVVTIVGGVILMLTMNWVLTLVIFIIIPPLIFLALYFGRRLERMSTVVQDLLASAISVLEEAISGIRVVKSFAREGYEEERFRKQVELTFSMVMKRTRFRAAFMPLISLLGFLATASIIWFGGREVIAGGITPGELVAFLFYMLMVAAPLGEFAGMYAQLREANGSASRIFEIMRAAPEPAQAPDGIRLPLIKGDVHFHDVSFAYENDVMVLEHINIDVPAAQVVALVGPSGVGKTTLVNLIPRFFDPTSGYIEVDGHDIQKVELNSLREQIGLVPQETFLFGGSVMENISYGRPGASMKDIVSAATAAFADDFIREMPQGYDTLIGERGVKLSAGQRQRLAIARALLKDPRILILDEATSALDTESERWVQMALEKLMEGRTTFVIAHRLSTIQHAHRILVLHEGHIVEDGTHSELLAQGGLYCRLWSLQFAEPGESIEQSLEAGD